MILDNKHITFNLNDKNQAEQYRKIFQPTQVEQNKNVAKMKRSFAAAEEGLEHFRKLVEDGKIKL
ncbi:hypothetical protein [Fructobacillus ficulneus]|uniref:Predicted Zn-dependent proteases n=1 Tax=Fructobacillus ficulneus TaxID=157463 RepID=A0A0K8MFN4_9LACO|nr:hypothetical protein [Fructobacillus ficulneus]GAO99302.1 predicted Zn-dependent proteases [Fructobacillus ficulneus]